MAKQHLYAKVPAKLSMFKKELSYDTFAVTSGINEAYIKDNILKLCEYNKNYKYTDSEKKLILDEKMPPVYMSYFSRKTGELIQSCISFLSEDFTGEAHGHFAHTLVLNEQETERLLTSLDEVTFSPSNFSRSFEDLTDISVTDDAPSTDYPEHEYIPEPLDQTADLTKKYDQRLIHALIYAILNATCGKGSKSIYIDIDSPIERYSDDSIELVNKLLSIFPHHIKRRVSAISFSASAKKSNMTFFNLKFVYGLDQQTSTINKSTSYIIDFRHNSVIGIKEGDTAYKKCESDIEFLCELLSNDERRKDFISFACRLMPKAADYKYELLSSIILLYNKVNQTADDSVILPNADSIYALLGAYERFKPHLSLDERCHILGAISRYSTQKLQIPSNIFAKLQKIYVSDCKECREVIMEKLLQLIHTDVMRKELFGFIKKSYDTETAKAKHIIMENLSRVFYGQFLQAELLNFFEVNFAHESDEVKEIIIEKLVASMRSEKLQDSIIAFFCNQYGVMDDNLRSIIRRALLKELPEADKFSEKIIDFFENNIENEPQKVQRSIIRSIFLRIENAEKIGDRRLIDMIYADPFNLRPMSKQLLEVIIIELKNVDVFKYLLKNMLLGKRLDGVTDTVKILCGNYSEMPDDVISALEDGLIGVIDRHRSKCSLFDYIELDNEMKSIVAQIDTELVRRLYSELYSARIREIVAEKLCDAFDYEAREDCLEIVVSYVSQTTDFHKCSEFSTIMMLDNLYTQMKNHNVKAAVKQLCGLVKTDCMMKSAASLIENYFSRIYADDAKYLKPLTLEQASEYLLAYATPALLSPDENNATTVYQLTVAKLRTLYIAHKQAEFRKKNKAVAAGTIKVNESQLSELVYKSAVELCAICSECDTNGVLTARLFGDTQNSLMRSFVTSFKEASAKSRSLMKKCDSYLEQRLPALRASYGMLSAKKRAKTDSDNKKASLFNRLFDAFKRKKTEKQPKRSSAQTSTEVAEPEAKSAEKKRRDKKKKRDEPRVVKHPRAKMDKLPRAIKPKSEDKK